ncbi:SprT-like family protein [Desulfuromusa kysingii]|uniref:SprT-like family protein n=1 Tax=Desulfuromusa kysingii TaxID=37625 RepID=A0A1H3XLA9_9BACT|nr:SprT-like domain-containing protein [Desulfuromusa kysingii]SEA00123.1 SprT-like family protein [Desulfuromusa kysingii]
MTVKQYADALNLWQQIELAVEGMLLNASKAGFLEKIATIPIKKSHATRRLGAYVSRGGEPVCIRLQFAQEPENLKQTFLHEVAHACDYLSRKAGSQPYQRAHGPSWKLWTNALGISAKSSGESEAVKDLHQQRLKLVAVCQKCGTEFHRVRRLNRNRRYTHQQCGGRLKTV